ncbi:MAG: hypothetical protein JWO06_2705 [Bacteroidota bacterium]|nr:hypothetical protein [Bacteroidota bacterium]
MRWKKLGNIFCPENVHPWMFSHAANPVAKHLHDGVYRVYFTCRNAASQSHIGYADMDMDNHYKIINIADEPVLTPGEIGGFDDSGVAMGYLLEINGQEFLYYLGWNLKVTVPWLNTIGLAIFNPATKKFEKTSRAPMMDRSNEDPFSISYPCVLFEDGIYRMWYGSNLKWGKDQSEMSHVIKYAESNDAIHWCRTNQIHINMEKPFEYAFSKPVVIKDDGGYRMWYSYRRSAPELDAYRIGYAESKDGLSWTRKDEEAGITVSEGWDSEMIEYPYIFDYKNERYMLYNGNGYGKTGFGIAILEK